MGVGVCVTEGVGVSVGVGVLVGVGVFVGVLVIVGVLVGAGGEVGAGVLVAPGGVVGPPGVGVLVVPPLSPTRGADPVADILVHCEMPLFSVGGICIIGSPQGSLPALNAFITLRSSCLKVERYFGGEFVFGSALVGRQGASTRPAYIVRSPLISRSRYLPLSSLFPKNLSVSSHALNTTLPFCTAI
jgi:hypothetical protein